ncbi:hypothetical protein DPMN_082418 [Dreissena polymorpha]|uniref:Uncharacterized protein n=1 Tax=Dreissena polymorpha TaxID=45954 RepID=A0A9D4BA51_DREPO|nr:hypothetical protein DPMN_082418 [Dreissena polymorpha]
MIPGNSEAVVDVFVERTEWDDHLSPDFHAEPTGAFNQRFSMIMAATMVDINRSPTCKIRVMNPFSHNVDLKQDARSR